MMQQRKAPARRKWRTGVDGDELEFECHEIEEIGNEKQLRIHLVST